MPESKPLTKQPQSLKPSLVVILTVLVLFCVVAIWLTNSLLEGNWTSYSTFAALLVGVGGVLSVGALPSGGVKEASTITALTAIGLGGIMLAYKEVVTGDKGDSHYFLIAVAIVAFVNFLGLVLVEFFRRSREAGPKYYTPLVKQGMAIVGGTVSSAILLSAGIWRQSQAWFVSGLLALLVVLVGVLIAARSVAEARSLDVRGKTRCGRRRPLRRSVRLRRPYSRRLLAASRKELRIPGRRTNDGL